MVPSLGMARSYHDSEIGMQLRSWEVISHPSPLSPVPITFSLSSETPAGQAASISQRSTVAHNITCRPKLPSRRKLQHVVLQSIPGPIYSCNYINTKFHSKHAILVAMPILTIEENSQSTHMKINIAFGNTLHKTHLMWHRRGP